MAKVIIGKSTTDTDWQPVKAQISLTVFDDEATDDMVEAEFARFQSGELTVEGYDILAIIDRSTIPDNDHYFYNAWVVDSDNNITIDFYRAKEVAKDKIKSALKSMVFKWYTDQLFGDKSPTYMSDVVTSFDTLKSEIDAETDFQSLKTRVKNFLLSYNITSELINGEMY